MKNKTAELVFILDRSGSMSGLEDDTIGGFNSMIEQQKKDPSPCFVSTYLFSNHAELVHDRLPLREIPKMTENEYHVYGCTALLDTIGQAINHIETIHRYARPKDVPEHTIFVITTDGMENASKLFTAYEIKKRIEEQKQKGWEFLFLAANIDAVETAGLYGIDAARSANYSPTSEGTASMFDSFSDVLSSFRDGGKISDDWADKLE